MIHPNKGKRKRNMLLRLRSNLGATPVFVVPFCQAQLNQNLDSFCASGHGVRTEIVRVQAGQEMNGYAGTHRGQEDGLGRAELVHGTHFARVGRATYFGHFRTIQTTFCCVAHALMIHPIKRKCKPIATAVHVVLQRMISCPQAPPGAELLP